MAKKLIAGNWKMHKDPQQAADLAHALLSELPPAALDVAVFPPTISLLTVAGILKNSLIGVGAQNIHWENNGAYTGETSAAMVQSIGCTYTLCGHSERRSMFGETDEIVGKKVAAALDYDLVPVLCVGENAAERDNKTYFEVIERQVRGGLFAWNGIKRVVIAYEPVWAIGTGLSATAGDAQEVCGFIRSLIAKLYDEQHASDITVLYGGSVNGDNIADLMTCPDVDGALVGGASLKAAEFAKILRNASL